MKLWAQSQPVSLASTSVAHFIVPKRGLSLEECEDALCIEHSSKRIVVAVADGATTASFSREWANILVRRFCESPCRDLREDWLVPARQMWRDSWRERPLAWNALEKVAQGSFATLLGITIDRHRWRALVIGDSCLFLVRDGKLVRSEPVRAAVDLRRDPWLVPTLPLVDAGEYARRGICRNGSIRPDDLLLLTTDALAGWFLIEAREGRRPWEVLAKCSIQDDFASLVDALRGDRLLRNDDVALVLIRIAMDLVT